MADNREPPPLFDEPLGGESKQQEIVEDDDDEDLFQSAIGTPNKKPPLATKPEEITKKNASDAAGDSHLLANTEKGSSKDSSDKVDIFEDEDVPLDSPTDDVSGGGGGLVNGNEPPIAQARPLTDETDIKELASAVATSVVPSIGLSEKDETTPSNASKVITTIPEDEEPKLDPSHHIEITVTDPQKIGDGMGAYMAYRVKTKTNIPIFSKQEFSVLRRFSDFLGIHSKLHEKHFHLGRIVPPAPEKSVMGMTKVKMSKDDPVVDEFVGRRRAALERYLNRTAHHPALVADADFREFLELESELPKATNTAALSGAGVMRLFSKMGESVNKMTYKMDESDQWFEEKQVQIDNLDQQLRKVHVAVESLVHHRRELSVMTGQFAKSTAMLGNSEEHTSLSRALSQLAEVEEKVEQLHGEQADHDLYNFCELLKDYINIIAAIKEVFHQRVKVFHNWQSDKALLSKKRENEARLQLQGKTDKITQAKAEVKEYEEKVTKSEQEFDAISRTIRKEMQQFDVSRVKDFKVTLTSYLENHMEQQQKLIQYWEAFLPEAEGVAIK